MSEEAVTKAELALQLEELARKLRMEMSEMKTELRTEMSEMRTDLRAEMVATKEELKIEIAERNEKMETTLLTEFRKYAVASEARLRVAEITGFGLMERMAAVEERVRELERRPLH